MIAYRFLGRGGHDRHRRRRWPLPRAGMPGEWVDGGGGGHEGIDAARADQLPHWIGEELWEVELAGPLEDLGGIAVAAPRGRLLRRLTAWDDDALARFATAGAWRARDAAARGLRAAGGDEVAEPLEAAATLRAVTGVVERLVDVLPLEAQDLALYAADAAAFAEGPAAFQRNVPFVAAHLAGRVAGPAGSDRFGSGFAAEKGWQAAWLARHLGLPLPA